jgi:predicted lipoprotein with Yx(FWY)xxD motif
VDTSSSSPSRKPHRRLAIAGVVAATVIGGIVTVPLFAGAQQAGHSNSKSTLQESKVGKYGEVLTDSAGYSLYALSTESKGKLHCTSSSCLGNWPPLLVAKTAMITAGSGVKGKISHVTRGSKWQVTYNGWPVYTFIGDSGPGKSNGEKIFAFGGTWYLLHAAATTNSGTQVKAVPSGGTTTTTNPGSTTTTTTPPGGTTTTTYPGY